MVKRNDIQILRGLAVLSVVFYHAAPEKFGSGFMGVDIFFVISGYLVAPMIMRAVSADIKMKKPRYLAIRQFYIRRFFRLAPSMATTFILTFLVTLLLIPPRDFQKTFGQACFAFLGLGNFGALLFSGDYFSPHPTPLLHTWSLSVEEQIYILLPILLFFSLQICKLRRNKVLRISILILTVTSYVCSQLLKIINQSELALQIDFYSPVTRFYEFGLGALVATSPRVIQLSNRVKIFLFLIISVSIFTPQKIPGISLNLILVTTCLFLCTASDMFKKSLSKPLLWIGDRSYSIYLFHLPLLFVAFYTPLWRNEIHREPLKIAAVLLTFLLANINYKYIETKWRDFGKKELRPDELISGASKFLVVPFLVSLGMYIASITSIFGLNPNGTPLPDPSLMLGKCYSLQGERPCYLSANSRLPKVLLVGDSHARHFGASFAKFAHDHQLSPVIWTQSGCQFILPSKKISIDYPTLNAKYAVVHKGETQSCFTHNLEIMSWIKHNPNSYLVITFRSSSMAEFDLGINPQRYRNLVALSLKKLSKEHSNILFIGPNPEYKDSAQFFGGGTLLWQKPYEESANPVVSRKNMVQNPFLDDYFYESTFKHKSSIVYKSGVKPFCDSSKCVRRVNGNWLYTDVNHLSIYGTEILRNFIQD